MKKNISLRENKYLCSRKDFDFGKLLRTNENGVFLLITRKNNYVKAWNSRTKYVNLWRVHLITSLPL